MSAIDLPESSVWHEVIQGIGAGDLASPGVGGPPNRAPQMLADRTRWLYDQLLPTKSIILVQTSAQSIPAYAWTNLVYHSATRNDFGTTLLVPLEYVRVPDNVAEVKVQAQCAFNEAVATRRVVIGLMTLINDAAPINGAVDFFNRYASNNFPMAAVHSGWIPVSVNDRISVAAMCNVSTLTFSATGALSCEILMR